MPQDWDTIAKFLLEGDPRAWLWLLGVGDVAGIEVIDADLATVVAEADKVIRVRTPVPHLVHVEFQTRSDAQMGGRLARYNLLLAYRHDVPVVSVLVLLRPEADGPSMRGVWESINPAGRGRHRFEYSVIRIWDEPVERFLQGPLGLVPLAPLTAATPADLPDILQAVHRRITAEAEPAHGRELDVVTSSLMGLRYPAELVTQYFPGVRDTRDSTTYQFILDEGRSEGRVEGRAAEARSYLLLMGTTKLGAPDAATRFAIEVITDVSRPERMGPRLFTVTSWAELLDTP